MPEITFELVTSLPSVGLLPDDYFAQSSPSDLPDIPDMPETGYGNHGDIQRRAQKAVDRVFGNLSDIQYAPTPLDLNGAELGRRVALAVQRYNRGTNDIDLNFFDICLALFDGREDFQPGFFDMYNAIVESYAESLFFTVPIFFENDPMGQNEALRRLYTMHWSHVNGLLRGTQAALRMAYGIAVTHSDLDVGHVQTISRSGKLPADFAGNF